jgi:large subunit ribosomal protein L33
MAKKGQGNQHVVLKSTESGHQYHTTKNKRKHPDRIELTKFDPTLNRRVVYKESKSSS